VQWSAGRLTVPLSASQDVLTPYLDACIRKYHKVDAGKSHVMNWSLDGVEGLPADGKLDLTKLGCGELSMRVRTGRNLKAFPLPGGMSKQNRCDMENVMYEAFKGLIADPAYGGRYVSLTPGHEAKISDDEYAELVKAHIMFKDMADDPYLASAGIASDWPYGRGCYISEDKKFIVWVGEEDHLRIMCMFKGTMLNDVFDRLSNAIKMMDSKAEFAYSATYGVVTSCPTNLGTGMRASVHIKIPNLTSDGTDAKAKAIAKPLGAFPPMNLEPFLLLRGCPER
jgi:creatine kinase